MKRIQLIAAALCLIMLTTVGAGVVVAKQTENPRQAGSSHLYFYDVTATGTHGKGKLQINVDKHTFEFNGQGFEPSAQIALKAKAEDSSEYAIFATGKATPSGNLHIAGTWEAAAAPAEVVGVFYGETTYGVRIDNFGDFFARVMCLYSTDGGVTWHESKLADVGPTGDTLKISCSDLGVPDHALVKVYVQVVGGVGGAKGKLGSEVFESDNSVYPQYYASYHIYGTQFKNTLVWWGFDYHF